MKKNIKNKIPYILFIALAALFVGFAAQPSQSLAYADRCASGAHKGYSNISYSSCSYDVAINGYTYAVSLSIAHCTSHYSDGTACQIAIAQSTAELSPGALSGSWAQACGNAWGNYNANIIGYPKPRVRPVTPANGGITPGGSGTTGNTTNGTATDTATTTLTRECTPGVDCPQTDLGQIITNAEVNPSYASQKNNMCPFFWTVGNQDVGQQISCQLIIKGKAVDVPDIEPDSVNGYLIPVGQSTFVCTRGGTATTTESQAITCNGNPNIIEE